MTEAACPETLELPLPSAANPAFYRIFDLKIQSEPLNSTTQAL
jgi:hypothetical protein